jgi:hypothetical protein
MKPATRASGFETNNAELDGRGWEPSKYLKGDMKRTEYRDRFNAPIGFHRDTFQEKPRKMKHK